VKWICAIALAALCSACASTGAVPRPFPVPGGSPGSGGSSGSGGSGGSAPAPANAPVTRNGFDGYALVGTALALRGVPYRNGGSEPTGGFDCSGFTQYVFAQYGVALPREVREQFKAGKTISADALSPGDLIFFSTTEPGPSHVGIAIGGDEFVHAPSSTGVVRVEHLSSSYWSPRFLGARRVN
jgi:cell wall-associated NlpC family hydrolase